MDNGLSKLASNVSKDSDEESKVEKITSNDRFKNSVMSFINSEMSNINDNNIEVLTDQQNIVNQKLFEVMEEDGLEVNEIFRLSDTLAKQKNMESQQKVSKIQALFDILRPTKESPNVLLNNERSEGEGNISGEMSANELQAILKFAQVIEGAKSTKKEED
ncbi:MAG: hypothetical protein PF569_06455 [Candidatus Woesearchaeota archaeon]|jgi:hypothetical protein|nr:hypothetical protein [Candidatus Woesearchaeota archaeon]